MVPLLNVLERDGLKTRLLGDRRCGRHCRNWMHRGSRRRQGMLKTRLAPACGFGAGCCRLRDLPHFFHGAEDRRLIDLGCPCLSESTHALAVLPQGHRRTLYHPIGDLHVDLVLGVEHKDTADIAWVTPNHERHQALACGDPGAQGVAVIADVVEDKSVALNGTPRQW